MTANTSTHQVTPTISPSPPLGKKASWNWIGNPRVVARKRARLHFPRLLGASQAGALVFARFPGPRFRRKCENAQTRAAERLVKANTDGSQGSNCCVMTASFDKDWSIGRTVRVRPQTAQARRSWNSPPSPILGSPGEIRREIQKQTGTKVCPSP